jgi:hypothetical protein
LAATVAEAGRIRRQANDDAPKPHDTIGGLSPIRSFTHDIFQIHISVEWVSSDSLLATAGGLVFPL